MKKNKKVEKVDTCSIPVQSVVIRRELFKKILEYWRDNLRMCYDGSIDDFEMVSKLDREKYKELYDYHECLKLIK